MTQIILSVVFLGSIFLACGITYRWPNWPITAYKRFRAVIWRPKAWWQHRA
jgi:hypothetical protein